MATQHSEAVGFGVPREVVDDLLASRRRQLLLVCLGEGTASITDLAAAVVARERGIDPDTVPADRRRAVVEELYQTHLPELTATGIVRYDSMCGTVELATPAVLQYVDE
jgi:hypothetical protein